MPGDDPRVYQHRSAGRRNNRWRDLKRILAERKDPFARMLTEKVLGYACGRRIERRDRPEVNRIVSEVKQGDYGFRCLIEQVVLSEAFRSK